MGSYYCDWTHSALMGALRKLKSSVAAREGFRSRGAKGRIGSAPNALRAATGKKHARRGAHAFALGVVFAQRDGDFVGAGYRFASDPFRPRHSEPRGGSDGLLGCRNRAAPAVQPGSPLLRGSFGPGKTFRTRITGEAGRLNLNGFLTQGENPQRLEVLRKYLEVKGVDLNERDRMIDCLLDWVDADNLERLNGAEEGPGYKPPNRPLQRLEEVKRIKGWEEFTSSDDWDSDFTLNSQGPIDPTWASREVLLSLPGMTEPLVDQFLTLRRGPDGIEGTQDDAVFKLG